MTIIAPAFSVALRCRALAAAAQKEAGAFAAPACRSVLLVMRPQSRPSGPAGKVFLVISVIEIPQIVPLVMVGRIKPLMPRIIEHDAVVRKSGDNELTIDQREGGEMAVYNAGLELIADEGCETTEGPLWHDDLQALFWLDIPAGRLYRYDPALGQHGLAYKSVPIGGFTIQADGALLLFGDRGRIWIWNPQSGETAAIVEEIAAERGTRFNDVIADPEGRVFAGTMPDGERPGRLYRLDRDGTLTVVLDDAGVSNGMGFTPDLAHMYHTDSAKGTITRYPYDRRSGALGTGSVVVRVPASDGVPDGMAIDEHGDLWSARWDGGALYHYAPDGGVLGAISFPARKVSSVTFGGPDWRAAYVTCAGGPDKASEGEGAGALYRTSLGVSGRPPFRSRIGLG
jgi:D-xylonolactonase